MSAPFIDVVVPTYNRAAMLERLAPSLLEQDYPDERYRVIVVDDGSTDRTRAALAEMARRDRRLEPLGSAHAGASAARNRGWRHGAGEIVAFTDDDCVADRGWLAALARGFAERPDALGIYGKTVTEPARVTPLTYQIVAHGPNANYRGCNIAYRREALAAAGGFDEASHYGEDTQLAAAVLTRGPILFRPDAVVVHPPRPRAFLDREKWRPELEGLYRLATRQPDFFRRHWGRYFPLAVALRLGVGSTAKHALVHAPWLVRNPPVYLKFLIRLLRERAVLLAMLPGFWREQVKKARAVENAEAGGSRRL